MYSEQEKLGDAKNLDSLTVLVRQPVQESDYFAWL